MVLLPSPAISADLSPQLKVALAFAKAAGECDVHAVVETVTDDYVHHILPESLGIPKLEGKEAFIGFYGKVFPHLEAYNILIKEVIETPGKVVCHVTADGKTKAGLEYKNEFIIITYVKQQSDGSFKIYAIKEFSDSKFTSGFIAAILGSAPPV